MGGKALNGCRIYIGFPIPTWKAKNSDWSSARVTVWVKNAGGTVQPQFNELTATHLVVDDKQWQNKTKAVQTALETNENGGKIHIVSPGWLECCLEEQRKCREGTYLWEKLDQAASGEKKKKKRGKSGVDEEGEVGDDAGGVRRAPQDMLGEVFQQSTEPFIEERDRRAYEAELAGELKAKREREEAEARVKKLERIAAEQKRKERADMMRKTVKKGRGEVFNENYHAWKDATGFSYDIMLTKVDTLTNSNERINLTIFETNKEPHTYATNLHFAGTGKCPINNILATIGSNHRTAIRLFRQAFQEKTGCNWDDRIKVHNERTLIRVNERDANSLQQVDARHGVEGSTKSRSRAAEDAVPFQQRFFEYVPPERSAKGLLPDGTDEVPEVVRQMRAMPSGHQGHSLFTQIDLTDEPAGQPVVTESAGTSSAEAFDFNELFAATNEPLTSPLGIPAFADTNEEPNGQLSMPETIMDGPILKGNTASADARPFDVNQLHTGSSNWAGQDPEVFDATTLQNEEHQFDFGSLPYETQVGQTQLAAGIGEDLLNLNNDQEFVTTHTSKRKRDDEPDDVEEEAPVAKKPATGVTEHSE